MSDSYKKTLNTYTHMAEQIMKEGSKLLEDFWEYGDWMMLVHCRHVLDEADLSQEDVKRLKKLDEGIAKTFTPDLLDEYAILEENATRWWNSDQK